MINFLIWIILGGVLGWLASIIMHTDANQGTFLNIVVGIIGAFVAGMVLTPLFGVATINQNNLFTNPTYSNRMQRRITGPTKNNFRKHCHVQKFRQMICRKQNIKRPIW